MTQTARRVAVKVLERGIVVVVTVVVAMRMSVEPGTVAAVSNASMYSSS
jgi:hypothetical protein